MVSSHVSMIPSPLLTLIQVGRGKHIRGLCCHVLDHCTCYLRKYSVCQKRQRMIDVSPQFTNTWYSSYFPMSTSTSYDNTGAEYNVSAILTDSKVLDLAKYEAYSPLFLS